MNLRSWSVTWMCLCLAIALSVACQRRPVPATSLAAASVEAQAADTWVVHTVTSRGEPVGGVQVFVGAIQPGFLGWERGGETNSKGSLRFERNELNLLGVAPDGRLAISLTERDLVFGSTDTIRLHVVDSRGRPSPNRTILLFPTETAEPIRSSGYLYPEAQVPPEVGKALLKSSDESGNVSFPNLPKDISFAVVLEGVRAERAQILGGAVKPGQSATILAADDLQIRGRVTTKRGAPVAGAAVQVMTQFDEWYDPQMTLEFATTTTDSSGAYRFDHLPNCTFNVKLDLSKNRPSRAIVRSRIDSGSWSQETYEGPDLPELWQDIPNSVLQVKSNRGSTLALDHSTAFDFETYTPAIVTVEFANPRNLDGCSLFVSNPVAECGAGVGQDVMHRKAVPLVMSPGRHTISISKFAERSTQLLAHVDVKEGENKHVRCVLPKGISKGALPSGAGAQEPAYRLRPFTAQGSDGRNYDASNLTAGKPVFLVHLADWNKPEAYADLNRLATMLSGKVRVVGVTFLKGKELKDAIRKFKIKFLLLQDGGLLVPQFGTGGDGRTVYELANMLVLPDGKVTHIWKGYNRSTLRQMTIDLYRATGIRASFDETRFPKAIRVGDYSFYGLPGP